MIVKSDSRPVVVIIAEDEALIRMLAAAALSDAGFVVHEAGHVLEALPILDYHGHGVHALFSDVHMPGVKQRAKVSRFWSAPLGVDRIKLMF